MGNFWVHGKTLGATIAHAVDAVEADGGKISTLKVIVQELGGDAFFSDADRERRRELTQKQRDCQRQGIALSASETEELERLITAEIEGAGLRAQTLSEELK